MLRPRADRRANPAGSDVPQRGRSVARVSGQPPRRAVAPATRGPPGPTPRRVSSCSVRSEGPTPSRGRRPRRSRSPRPVPEGPVRRAPGRGTGHPEGIPVRPPRGSAGQSSPEGSVCRRSAGPRTPSPRRVPSSSARRRRSDITDRSRAIPAANHTPHQVSLLRGPANSVGSRRVSPSSSVRCVHQPDHPFSGRCASPVGRRRPGRTPRDALPGLPGRTLPVSRSVRLSVLP